MEVSSKFDGLFIYWVIDMSLKLSLAAAAVLAATSFSVQAAEAPAAQAPVATQIQIVPGYGNLDCPNFDVNCPRAQQAAPAVRAGAPVPRHLMGGEVPPPRHHHAMRGQVPPAPPAPVAAPVPPAPEAAPVPPAPPAPVAAPVPPAPPAPVAAPVPPAPPAPVAASVPPAPPAPRAAAMGVPAPRHAVRVHGPRPMGADQPLRGPKKFTVDEINNHKRRMLNDWCPQHNQPLKACLGPEVEAFVAPELAKLQDLQDQLFVKDQVLKAQVNAGEDAATVTKYANDVNKARRDIRNFVVDLKTKVHKMAADHKAGAQAAPAKAAPKK